MEETKSTSLRIPVLVLAEARKVADAEGIRQAQVLNRWLRDRAFGGRQAIPDLEVPEEALEVLDWLRSREDLLSGVDSGKVERGSRTAQGIEGLERSVAQKKFAMKNPVVLALSEAVGMSGSPENMVAFRPAPSIRSVPYIAEESAPVRICAACEANLMMVKAKWVCGHVDCAMYGQEQNGGINNGADKSGVAEDGHGGMGGPASFGIAVAGEEAERAVDKGAGADSGIASVAGDSGEKKIASAPGMIVPLADWDLAMELDGDSEDLGGVVYERDEYSQ